MCVSGDETKVRRLIRNGTKLVNAILDGEWLKRPRNHIGPDPRIASGRSS